MDGRSTDDTFLQLEQLRYSLSNDANVDFQVYRLPRHLKRTFGAQLRFAVEKASHAYLVFVHADTVLGPEWDDVVVRTLNQPGVVAGVFPYVAALPNDYAWLWLVSWSVYGHLLNFVRWCSVRWCGHAVGEQALFIHAFYFRLMGGLEGLEMGAMPGGLSASRNCLQHGSVAISGDPVATLPRRWMRRSLVKGLCMEALMLVAARVGVSPPLRHDLYAMCPRLNRELSAGECG